jgi:hypothetical protein
VIAQHLVEDLPQLAAGIVAFDFWIANGDRHEKNLSYSRNPPLPLFVFDHERALLGENRQGALDRLDALANVPPAGGCLVPLITSGVDCIAWCERIAAVTRPTISDVCLHAEHVGAVTAAERQAALDFLDTRKTELANMLHDALPNVTTWGLPLP